MRSVPSDILEKLKNKYKINNLRKVAELYGTGIPEKYWFTKPTPNQQKIINHIFSIIENKQPLILFVDSAERGSVIGCEFLKIYGKLKHSRLLDFMFVTNKMVDRFGQINLDLLNELENEDLIIVSNIKSYGNFYIQKIYPVFASFVDGLLNSIMQKQIILIIEYSGEIDDVDKSFGNEFVRTMNGFQFYQCPIEEAYIK